MSPATLTMPPVYSPRWPRYLRLAMTGSENPNYRHGKYARRRRDLEHQVDTMLAQLRPGRLLERILRLAPGVRDQVTAGLGLLTGDAHPEHWALADPRPGHPARWYVPQAALAFAVAWLRKAREIQRLIFFDPASINSTIASIYKEGGSRGRTGGRHSPADEIRRLEAWSRARGVPWSGTPTPETP